MSRCLRRPGRQCTDAEASREIHPIPLLHFWQKSRCLPKSLVVRDGPLQAQVELQQPKLSVLSISDNLRFQCGATASWPSCRETKHAETTPSDRKSNARRSRTFSLALQVTNQRQTRLNHQQSPNCITSSSIHPKYTSVPLPPHEPARLASGSLLREASQKNPSAKAAVTHRSRFEPRDGRLGSWGVGRPRTDTPGGVPSDPTITWPPPRPLTLLLCTEYALAEGRWPGCTG